MPGHRAQALMKGRSFMSGYSVTVTGPWAPLVTAHHWAHTVWDRARLLWNSVTTTAGRFGRVGATAATTALAVIGSDTGYRVTGRLLSSLGRLTGAAATQLARIVGRAAQATGDALLELIAVFSPQAAKWLHATTRRHILTPAEQWATAVRASSCQIGRVLAQLVASPLVQVTTTRAAQAASIILGVHTISRGAVAAKLVAAAPATMDAVIWLTNPTNAIVLVAGVFLLSLGVAAAMLLRTSRGLIPETGEATLATVTPAEADQVTALPTVGTLDLRKIAAALSIDVTTDGSIVVHGIPDHLPTHIGEQVARIAADAAGRRLQQILPLRSALTRDDRSHLTQVARAAVRVNRQMVRP